MLGLLLLLLLLLHVVLNVLRRVLLLVVGWRIMPRRLGLLHWRRMLHVMAALGARRHLLRNALLLEHCEERQINE